MILPLLERAAALPLGDRGFVVLLVFLGIVALGAVAFVVASLLLRARNNAIARSWAAFEARCDPVMLDVLAGAAAPETLRAVLAPADDRRFIEYLLRYGRRIRGQERLLLGEIAAPHLYAVSGDLRSRSVERRARATQAIGELGPAVYRAELLEALRDPAPLVCMVAAVALSREYRAEDVLRVIRATSRLTLLTTRLLVSMLRRLGPQAAWAFREVLADASEPPKLRTVAARVLAGFNDQEAGDIALREVQATTDTDLRVALLQLLQRVGSAEHLDVVRRLVADPDAAVRGAAIRLIGALGGETDLPLLQAALDDPVSWVAIHAAEALRRSGRTDLLETLAQTRSHRSSVLMSEVLFRDAGP